MELTRRALTLPRARRRRPPSPRRLLGLAWLGLCLVNLARCVTRALGGDGWQLIFAVMWVGLYLWWRRITRRWAHLDARQVPMLPGELRVQLTCVAFQAVATLVFLAVP